jgi:hypothetical protein
LLRSFTACRVSCIVQVHGRRHAPTIDQVGKKINQLSFKSSNQVSRMTGLGNVKIKLSRVTSVPAVTSCWWTEADSLPHTIFVHSSYLMRSTAAHHGVFRTVHSTAGTQCYPVYGINLKKISQPRGTLVSVNLAIARVSASIHPRGGKTHIMREGIGKGSSGLWFQTEQCQPANAVPKSGASRAWTGCQTDGLIPMLPLLYIMWHGAQGSCKGKGGSATGGCGRHVEITAADSRPTSRGVAAISKRVGITALSKSVLPVTYCLSGREQCVWAIGANCCFVRPELADNPGRRGTGGTGEPGQECHVSYPPAFLNGACFFGKAVLTACPPGGSLTACSI